MRIKQLILRAFGQFTDKKLDLGDKPKSGSDFHIFYGPNEAGKTTIMEAWLRFLFGFPLQDSYYFKYGRQASSISAVLQANGEEVKLTRIADGRRSVLRDEQNQIANDGFLLSAMGMLSDENNYRNMLCLDDKGLEKGGKAILDSKADTANLLFAAGSGLSGFSQILAERAAEIAEIHKPHGKNTLLAEKLRDYDDVKRQLEESSISPAGYDQLKQRLSEAMAREEELAQKQKDLWDKLTLMNDARRGYETSAELNKTFSAAVADMKYAAADLGIETEGDDNSVYGRLKPLSVNSVELQNLRDMQTEQRNLAQRFAEQNNELKAAEEKLAKMRTVCAARRGALPPREARQELESLMRDMAADDLKQEYISAMARKKDKQEQARASLQKLIFKGKAFTAVPPAKFTAQEADKKAKRIVQLASLLERQNEALSAREVDLEQIEKHIAALRDQSGRRIAPARENL